jgi:hypothetical protein
LPQEVREAIASGAIEASVGDLIATILDPAQQKAALKDILKGENEYDAEGERLNIPLSFRKAKSLVESKYRQNLKAAVFSLAADNLGAVSCEACPKRTGNIEGLPTGTAPNVCTEPACFQKKTAAHAEAILQTYREEGFKVLSVAECEDLWNYTGVELGYGGDYVLSENTAYWDDRHKGVSYAEALGRKLPDPVIAVDRKANAHKLYPAKECQLLLVQMGLVKSDEEENTRSAEELEIAEESRKLDAEACVRLAARVVAGVEASSEATPWMLHLLHCLDEADLLNHELIAKRRGWDLTKGHIQDYAKLLPLPLLSGLLAEAFIAGDSWRAYYDEGAMEAMAAAIGTGDTMESVRAELIAEREKAEEAESRGSKVEPKASRVEGRKSKAKAAKPAKAKAKPAKPAKKKKSTKAKK